MQDFPYSKQKKHGVIKWILIGNIFVFFIALNLLPGRYGAFSVSAQSPTPTPDRLAEPELSEDPTQYEAGEYLYWMNCMPCHGDYGQGLTDEFRELWPEDHQNCWGRGCHGGRNMDEGFPIPKYIPAIISTTGDALAFHDPEELYSYLLTTHPPQHPGYLPEEEYWAMTAFVLAENGLISQESEIGPNLGITTEKVLVSSVSGLLVLAFCGEIIWLRTREKLGVSHSQ